MTLKERNFITTILDQLATNGSVSMDELKIFNYTSKDISKLRDSIIDKRTINITL